MLELLGYMVAAYGITRLAQTSKFSESDGWMQLVGTIGIAALIVLALLLSDQADSLSGLGF